jgi:hypothetical protein
MWLERDDAYLRLEESFDLLVAREDLQGYLTSLASTATTAADFDGSNFEAPIGHQVWAAGVTYYPSRTARGRFSSCFDEGQPYWRDRSRKPYDRWLGFHVAPSRDFLVRLVADS